MAESLQIPNDLRSLGFTGTNDKPRRYRLLLGTQGLEKRGKTHFAYTAPGPIASISMDVGGEGMAEKFSGKVMEFVQHIPVPVIGSKTSNHKLYIDAWIRSKAAYEKAVQHPKVRTVVLDTGSDLWELMRLAEFGQLNKTGDRRQNYLVLNQMYRSLVRIAYETDKNLIVIHKVKKQYVSKTNDKGQLVSDWNGEYERAGFGESGYLIQANLEHFRDQDTGEFGIRILDCRQDPWLAGLTLTGPDCTFSGLAQMVFPDSKPEDWK